MGDPEEIDDDPNEANPSPGSTSSMFELTSAGVGVMPDPSDNPAGHISPHSEAGTRISFELVNVGGSAGVARIGIEINDTFFEEIESEQIEVGMTWAAYSSLGRLSPGSHEVLVYVNPGSGSNDHGTNRFELE
jgi:hypothetical protein